jgi:hypothetical protein
MKVASREPPGGMKLRFKENVDEQSTNIIIETQN